jgi:hypothetical protein
MSQTKKWLSVFFRDGLEASKWERQIVSQFQLAYENAQRPKDMALFSFTPGGATGLYMTPESIRYCSSILALLPWDESGPPGTPSCWLAGDESPNI